MTEWMDREPKAEEPEEIKRDRWGGIVGATNEVPGMVRWVSGESHYFLKHNSPGRPIFALGLEHRIGDMAYIFDTSIEFDDDEAVDLIDRIASFQDLPTYSELMDVSSKLNALLLETERMDRPEDRYFRDKLRDILGKS